MFLISIARFKVFLLLALLILLFQYQGYSQDDRSLYHQGVKLASEGQIDFAFMSFHRLLNDFPESEHYHQALFAVGEYYLSIGGYDDAIQSFNQLVDNYPESETRPFALAYLLKIAQQQAKQDTVEKLKKELIGSQQLSLLFREFKELKYVSPLGKNYKALNFIDKITICIEDEPLVEVSF